jgi:hypothetical protein
VRVKFPSSPDAERPTKLAASLSRRCATPRLTECLGEEPRQKLIRSDREGHVEPMPGPPVELRRPAGSPSRAAWRQASILGTEQAVVDEPVEVEGGHRSANADFVRGLVTTDRMGLVAHEVV